MNDNNWEFWSWSPGHNIEPSLPTSSQAWLRSIFAYIDSEAVDALLGQTTYPDEPDADSR